MSDSRSDTESICSRLGAKYLFDNPGSMGNVQITPLTPAAITKLKNTDFEWTISEYSKLVEDGSLPPNHHSLLLGHDQLSGVIFNTRILEDTTGYDKKLLGQWKGRRVHANFESLSGTFVLTKCATFPIRNKTVFIVEGQNDALSTYAYLAKYHSDIVVVNLAGSSFNSKVSEFLSPYICLNRCEFIIYMDDDNGDQHLSKKIAVELQQLAGVHEKQLTIAQNIFPEIGTLDPDDYFTARIQDDVCNSVEIDRRIPGIDKIGTNRTTVSIDKARRELDELSVFLEYQENVSTEMFGVKLPKVAGKEYYNSAHYYTKAFLLGSAESEMNAVLAIEPNSDIEEYERNLLCNLDVFTRSQGTATLCKIPLYPLQDPFRKYFQDESLNWNPTSRKVWKENKHDLKLIRAHVVNKVRQLRNAVHQESRLFDSQGNALQPIRHSLELKTQQPGLHVNTAPLGAGKSTGIQDYLIDQNLNYFRAVYRTANHCLNETGTSSTFWGILLREQAKANASQPRKPKKSITEKSIAEKEKARRATAKAKAKITKDKAAKEKTSNAKNKLKSWTKQIKPFIDKIGESSWLDLDGDLSESRVSSGSLADMVDILVDLFDAMPDIEPGLIVVGNNKELDEHAFIGSLIGLDTSMILALNADNLESNAIRDFVVSNVACPVITLARYKNSNFSSYKGRLRKIIFDEVPLIGSKNIHKSIVKYACQQIRLLDTDNIDYSNLVDGYIRPPDTSESELDTDVPHKAIFEGSMCRLELKLRKVISDQINYAVKHPENIERYLFVSLLINSISKDDDFAEYILLLLRGNNYLALFEKEQLICRLVDLFIMIGLNQKDMPIDEERQDVTRIKYLLPALQNDFRIFDATASVVNNNLSASFDNLRIAYPPVTIQPAKTKLSDITWRVNRYPLFGKRPSKKEDETLTVGDTSMDASMYKSAIDGLRKSIRLVCDPDASDDFLYMRDYVKLSHVVLMTVGSFIGKKIMVELNNPTVCKIKETIRPAYVAPQSSGMTATYTYGTCRIDFDLRISDSVFSKKKFDKFKSSLDSASAPSYMDNLIQTYASSTNYLLRILIKDAVEKHIKDKSRTLIFSYNFSNIEFTEIDSANWQGISRSINSTANTFEGIVENIGKSVATALDVDIGIVKSAVVTIGHLTQQAMGSNSYREFNRVILLGEPYKPTKVVNANRGVQGQDSSVDGAMVAALCQAIGRGIVRCGTSTSCSPMTVETYDIPASTVIEAKKFFDEVTWDISAVPSELINTVCSSDDPEKLSLAAMGYGQSGSIHHVVSEHAKNIANHILQHRTL